jgi:hypothetical protein
MVTILFSAFFAPDQLATLFIQALFIFVLVFELLLNGVITFISDVVFAIASFISTSLSFIPNDTANTVLVLQSMALQGVEGLTNGYYVFLEEISIIFENLLNVNISYVAGQSPYQAITVTIDNFEVLIDQTIGGALESLKKFLNRLPKPG